ncbi:uncharacterized protein B0T23DRAFT_186847 [Neurospora hispaniola]|uniref:WD40 repeat-like protein n=1 Tax=Neurospora hispaniola TaxID=588809 RepID=A0AAJ0MPD2_9PEZI|nr:hypothetical protein B0T23DRAFT_186847 [Neurospora hispaniola]
MVELRTPRKTSKASKMDANGETASLKKRKREPKEETTASQKRQRSKPKTQPAAANGNVDDTTDSQESTLFENKDLQTANGDLELTDASNTLTTRNTSAWKVSNPMGGRMLDIDPIFSLDERYLLITYNTSIQVYSTEDSLLVRRISLPITKLDSGAELSSPHIVASALSASAPEFLWVACSDGRIWHLNWATGEGAETPFTIDVKKVLDMTVESVDIRDKQEDVLFILQKLTKSSAQIVAYDLKALRKKTGKLIHTYDENPQLLRSAAGGRLIVAAAKETLHIGTLKSKGKTVKAVDDLEYAFHSFGVPDLVTCLDIRPTLQTTKKGGIEIQFVDLVIGCARGAIYVYGDLLSKLPGSATKGGPIQPRKLHWHRRAVHSVKWSEDGNYLISGGAETVLVLWQLDTGKREFLPHLSATIENIVVSPKGSSYALHLDDNSAMVLSTAEMKPTTYVSGIQSLVLSDKPSKESLVRRVWRSVDEISTPLITTSNPTNPSQIFLCVGNGQQASSTGNAPSTPLIQVFDVSSFQGVSKHPIARTNPTDTNMTSQGAPIIEPRVTKMAFSHDGKWLASVDEWQPPERDLEPLLTGSKTPCEVSRERREIYLKFWEIEAEDNSLQLVSRINEAHFTTESETILDVASDPISSRFASLGTDGVVRFWSPKLRRKDGLASTGPEGQQLRTWSCSRAVELPAYGQLEEAVEVSPKTPRSGALAFSEDGSVLFAAYGPSSGAVVVVIDTATGAIRDTIPDLSRGDIRGVEAVSSSLIILSEDLTVYDIVSDEVQYSFALKETSEAAKQMTHLAVNRESRSFAVAAPIPNSSQEKLKKGAKSELVVFSVDEEVPQLIQMFPQVITAVLPATNSAGFVAVDSAAQIWSITESGEQAQMLQPLADLNMEESASAVAPVDHAVEDGEASDEEMQDADADVGMEDDDYDVHQAVVAPQKLAEIFNAAPAFAMAPIEDIFNQVASLFSTRPSTI